MAKLSNRTYGVEFEIFFTERNWKKLLRDFGVTESGDWYADTREVLAAIGLPDWEAEHDGSIKGGDVQVEVKTPILQGPSGLKQVMNFCGVFKKYAQVNESAGVHVHVGAGDFKDPNSTAERLTMALLHYKNVEDIFDSLTMAHRRGNASYYARSPYSSGRILAQYKDIISSNRRSIISMISALQDDRYMKMNLASLIDHGTIEFRQMHGTLNGELVKNWIIICMAFLDTVRETEGHFVEMLKALKADRSEIKSEMTKVQETKVAQVFAFYLVHEILIHGLLPSSTNSDFKRLMKKDVKERDAASLAQKVYPYITDIQQANRNGQSYLYFYIPAKAFEFMFRPDSIGYGLKLAIDAFKENPQNVMFVRNCHIANDASGVRVLMNKNAAIAVAEEYLGVGSTGISISKDYLDTVEKSKELTAKGLPSRNISKLSQQLAKSPMYEGKKGKK